MEYPFWPSRVFFEPAALQYPRGRELFDLFHDQDVPVRITASHNRVTGIPGGSARESFMEAKRTLVFGVRRAASFQTCKPSAHYQLPLATGCPGGCRYCYLHTTLGKKPYLRAYINVEDLLERAGVYIREREPEQTLFEGAAVSDPLFVEPFTGGVSAAVRYFAGCDQGRFRLVTKFCAVEPFLNLEHRGHTHFRFSINAPEIIKRYEKGTPPLEKRLAAARKIAAANYPTGFLIAPIFLDEGWPDRYRGLLEHLRQNLPVNGLLPTFELITHRFTLRAKQNISEIFPDAALDMETERRQFRYGQFGYGKYVYTKDMMKEAELLFRQEIARLFPASTIEYFV
ncbi:MAG: spore photoproduct lyase [Bacillota bacterium]